MNYDKERHQRFEEYLNAVKQEYGLITMLVLQIFMILVHGGRVIKAEAEPKNIDTFDEIYSISMIKIMNIIQDLTGIKIGPAEFNMFNEQMTDYVEKNIDTFTLPNLPELKKAMHNDKLLLAMLGLAVISVKNERVEDLVKDLESVFYMLGTVHDDTTKTDTVVGVKRMAELTATYTTLKSIDKIQVKDIEEEFDKLK